jgi:amino acid adenylation domain-containing protein/thioester reductase-like protein
LNFHKDRQRAEKPTYQGAVYLFSLPATLIRSIRQLAQQHKVTLFTILFSSVAAILYRYTQQEDFNLGLAYSQRRDAQLDPLIGFFVNMLPIRIQIAEPISFILFMKTIQRTLMDAYRYSAPLENIINELNLPKATSVHPLFEMAVILHDLPYLDLSFKGLEASLWNPSLITASDQHSSKFDLTFEMEILKNGELTAKIEYATDIFEKQTIQNLAKYWTTLCEGIVQASESGIARLPLLKPTDERDLIQKWSQLGICYATDKNILDVFLEQVNHRPNAIAVIDQDRSITYETLNQKTNQLAHYMLSIKDLSKPEHIIGVALNGSLDFITSILAILKTGSAYLPIDPAFPINRIEFMLQDSSAALLVTKSLYQEKINALELPIVYLDSPETLDELSKQPTINSDKKVLPKNLAYVIYTSGSTGQPKGVMIEHNSVVQLTKNYPFKVSLNDIVAQINNVTFDASTFEIWSALLNGAKLVIHSKSELFDVENFKEKISHENINIIFLTTLLFHRLLLNKNMFRKIKYLFFGGEKLAKSDKLHELINEKDNSPKHLVHVYGPTENTTFSTFFMIHNKNHTQTELPIGRASADTLLYVLDNFQSPVPAGVPGELYLGGLGLARGYLHRSKLTSDRFIENPFKTDGSYLYRTGDWVRYFPDGNLIFLGRIDSQVKISGYRIELSEIEKSITSHENVKETVVITQERYGQKKLVAYLTLKKAELDKRTLKELRKLLTEHLPSYMLPQHFIVLDELPVTTSGKLNRQALIYIPINAKQNLKVALPKTDTEKKLYELWKGVLKIDDLDIHDDFFEIGGTSLLAMDLNYQINHKITPIHYSTLFSHPTIKAQARLLNIPAYKRTNELISIGDLKQQSILNPDIKALADSFFMYSKNPKAVLLTGVTGFLGVFLLLELLKVTQARVYCLIRAKTKAQASTRLIENIKVYELQNEIDFTRIYLIPGDIKRKHLGLPHNDYQSLSQKIEVIYHAASTVNFVQPYSSLEGNNVLGTENLLKFATNNRTKALHYISSAAVFSFAHYFNHKKSVLLESPVVWNENVSRALVKDLGYTQSKAVAERLVWNAGQKGIPISIYRVGFILCHSQSGIGNKHQLWARLVRDCLSLGFYPKFENLKEEFVTVDYAAQAIIHIANQKSCLGQIFHIMPSKEKNITTNKFFTMLNQAGASLNPEPFKLWINRLEHHVNLGNESSLKLLMPLFTDNVQDNLTLLELYQNSPEFSVKNTKKALTGAMKGMVDDFISYDTIGRYLRYFYKNKK